MASILFKKSFLFASFNFFHSHTILDEWWFWFRKGSAKFKSGHCRAQQCVLGLVDKISSSNTLGYRFDTRYLDIYPYLYKWFHKVVGGPGAPLTLANSRKGRGSSQKEICLHDHLHNFPHRQSLQVHQASFFSLRFRHKIVRWFWNYLKVYRHCRKLLVPNS